MATKKTTTKTPLLEGTPEHEKMVKKVLKGQLAGTIDMLARLDLVEANNIKIGDSFVAFRFQAVKADK